MSMCLWNTGVKSNHSKTYVAIELIRRRDSILRVYTHNISLLAYSINYIFDLLVYQTQKLGSGRLVVEIVCKICYSFCRTYLTRKPVLGRH